MAGYYTCLVLFCLVLSCFVLFCLDLSLSYLVLSYLVLCCVVLSCFALSCLAVSCRVMSLSCLCRVFVVSVSLSCLCRVFVVSLSCLVLSCLVFSKKEDGESIHVSDLEEHSSASKCLLLPSVIKCLSDVGSSVIILHPVSFYLQHQRDNGERHQWYT